MFKRYLHLLGCMAVLYGCMITYTALGCLETVLILLLVSLFMVKVFCLTKGQLGVLIILFALLTSSSWLYEKTCENKWNRIQGLEGQSFFVTGVVERENPFKTDRCELKIEKVTPVEGVNISKPLDLSWLIGQKMTLQIESNGFGGSQNRQPVVSKAFEHHAGQRLEVIIRPLLAKRAGNPGCFDYRLYLALKNIWLTAYVNEGSLHWKDSVSSASKVRENLILEIKSRLDRFNVKESLGPSLGMLLGFDDFMSDAAVSDYFMAGTVHVLTVSGFHFALVYAVLSSLMKKLPVPYNVRIGLSVAFILLFLLLTGIKFAPYRAGVSMLLMLGAPYFKRRFDLATAASVIVLPEIIVNPYKAADMSLVLCYLACLAISHGAWAAQKATRTNNWPKILKTVAMPVLFLIVVQCTLWLPIISGNNTVNLLSIPSNLLGTALSGNMLLMNTALVLMNFKSAWWCGLFAHLNGVGFLLMDLINRLYKLWAGSVVVLGDPGGVVVVVYMLVLFLCVLSANTKVVKQWGVLRILGVSMLLIFVTQLWIWNEQRLPKFYFFDVGQGDGMLVRTPNGRLLAFDCGPELFDFQQAVLNIGVNRVSRLYFTHGHKDHAGGLISLTGKVQIDQYGLGAHSAFESVAQPPKEKIKTIKDGTVEIWDGIRVEAFEAAKVSGTKTDENENGIIYLISYGTSDILITGDAGDELQRAALNKITKENKRVEVIKLSHHGSPKSTSFELAQVMKPDLVVVSVGKNRYGHPSEDLLACFESLGSMLVRTDVRGCVMLRTDGKRITMSAFKKTKWALKSSAQ